MEILYKSFLKCPKDVCFDGEDPDEEILYCFRKHLITNFGWVLLFMLFLIVPTFLPSFLEFTSSDIQNQIPGVYKIVGVVFWYVFAFGFAFSSFLSWYFNVYIVTSRRLVDIDFSGLIHRRFSEALLSNVEDITHQIGGVAQLIFHYGSVHVQTAGELREISFEHVPDPAKVQDIISDLHAKGARGGRFDD